MHKPWYSFLYVKSPITKIVMGAGALLLTLALFVFAARIEDARMQAQTASWSGRTIEKGAEIFANNCTSCHGEDGKGKVGVAPALHSHYFFTQRLADVGFTGSLHNYIAGTVAAGRPSKALSQWAAIMPTWGNRFGGPLRDDQVESVTRFVMNWEQDAVQQTAEQDPWQPFQDAKTTTITGTVTTAPSTTPSGEPRAPDVLFTAMGCVSCHNLQADHIDNNVEGVGPNLGNLNELAPNMVAGQDALTYVETSIKDPNAFIVEGYAAGVMTQNFKDKMSEEEIAHLAQWLLDQSASN